MRLGVLVPQAGPWASLLERSVEAEQLGFDSVWLADHFHVESMPHVELLDAMTALAGIAVAVPRIRLGALTTNTIYRNPAIVAKQAATLDGMSGGRFEMGLGAGVYGTDHRMTGVPQWTPRERVDRFIEFSGIVDRLMRGENVDGGDFYPLQQAIVRPRPVQAPRPPITIGANGPRMLGVAAAIADRWNTWGGPGLTSDDFWRLADERAEAFDSAVRAAARDRADVIRSLYAYRPLHPWASDVAFREITARAANIGFDEVIVPWPGFLVESKAELQVRVMREVLSGRVAAT